MSDWHVIRILAPILLPLLFLGLLVLLGLLRTGLLELWSTAIANGQLAWAGLGMCVGALYEQRHFRLILTSTGVDDALFWTVILVLLLQIVIAATAPLIMQLRSHDLNERSILKRRSVIIASIVLCAAAAFLFAAVHATRQSCQLGA